MHKYLERENEVTFDKIFNQKIGKENLHKRRLQTLNN